MTENEVKPDGTVSARTTFRASAVPALATVTVKVSGAPAIARAGVEAEETVSIGAGAPT